ncbi:ABC transporter permease [Geothrix sp. PMB-07]|uniref:ABC transporter permease n=1 Tax=Geothrix sp. PMB-07 TaxID=3068640 RepID=UPI0027412A04|nr:ABC transporter permease [Geothrix sp. PMB-07]WLT33553.1 ABC transporter permease [Geothrix sp. PMB-07]
MPIRLHFQNANRALRQRPGFTVAAVLTLALGIGATTAIYSMFDRIVVNPSIMPEPSRVVAIWEQGKPCDERDAFSLAQFRDLQEQNTSFESMSLYRRIPLSLAGDGPAEAYDGGQVSWNVFSLMNVKPLLGRTFTQAEGTFGGPDAVVLGYAMWKRRFGSDPTVIGRRLRLNGVSREVVGVLGPESLRDMLLFEVDGYIPVAPSPAQLADRIAPFGLLLARLKPGVTMASAHQDLKRVMEELGARFPVAVGKKTAWLEPITRAITTQSATPMAIGLGLAALVLLIACANVASLLLAKGLERQREMATRIALGASRSQLVGQMLAESALLALLGALGSLGVARAVMGVFPAVMAPLGDLLAVRIDGRVLVFTISLSILAVLLFGALPAWRIARLDPGALMKEGTKGSEGRTHHRLRRALVVLEVAMASCVLIGASLLLRSLSKLNEVPTGLQPGGLLTAAFILPSSKYAVPEARQAFLDVTLAKVASLPGVQAAALTTNLPLGQREGGSYDIEGQSLPKGQVNSGEERGITPGYFSALGIPLLRGRTFMDQDVNGVCIINETLARKHWPGEDPLGKRLSVEGPSGPWLSVVGVSTPVRQTMGQPLVPEVFVPLSRKVAADGTYIALRTSGSPQTLIPALREAMRSLDPDLALLQARTGDELLTHNMVMMVGRVSGYLTGGLGLLALLLAGGGLYGILSFQVAMRTREIGIRMAMGATIQAVIRMVLSDGLRMVGWGLALGVPGGFALGYAISTQLFGIVPADPLTFIAVPLVLAAVAVASCLGPARRAAHLEPSAALREG